MKLTSFYAAPVCTPSRAQMMTGCYAKRVSLPNVIFPACPTGHQCQGTHRRRACSSSRATRRWRSANGTSATSPTFLPTRRGFDHYLGLPYSNDMGGRSKGKRRCRLAARRQSHRSAGQSGHAHRAIHRGSRQIHHRQQGPAVLPLLPAHRRPRPAAPGEKFKGKSANGTYGDWVEEVDWSVGRVLDTLRELKLSRATLVLFTSDNGPWLTQGKNGGVAGPLRGGKGSTWEGGMREPTIAWWPGKIAAGTACDAPMSEIDVLPTLVKLAGGTVPADRKIDGKDIWPLLAGQTKESPHEALFYFNGNDSKPSAPVRGNWRSRRKARAIPQRRRPTGQAHRPAPLQPRHRHRRNDRCRRAACRRRRAVGEAHRADGRRPRRGRHRPRRASARPRVKIPSRC